MSTWRGVGWVGLRWVDNKTLSRN